MAWGKNVHLHCLTYMMLRCCTSSCTSSHTWCYAALRRLALPHIYDATLVYVHLALPHNIWCYASCYVVLHFLTYMMLRSCMSSCTSSHIWCYATCMSSCTSSHIWCYAAVRPFCTSSHIWCNAAVRLFARGRMFALGSGDGQQFPQKPFEAHCRNCEEHLAQKKSAAEVFYISNEKYARTF